MSSPKAAAPALSSLVSVFEPAASPAPRAARERFTADVDGPRASLSSAATAAQASSSSRVAARVSSSSAGGASLGGARRVLPAPAVPSDGAGVARLKARIFAREADVQEAAARLARMADELERLGGLFVAAQDGGGGRNATEYVPPPMGAVSVFGEEAVEAAKAAGKRVTAPSKGGVRSKGLGEVRAAVRSMPAGGGEDASVEKPKVGGSLAEILAAARGGSRVKSETPKYASLLKEE